MARVLSAARAKAQLAECLRKAENGESVIITRHGKPVAALVAVDRSTLRTQKRARAGAGFAGGWRGSGDFVKALGKLRRTQPRRAPTLD